VKLGDRSGEDRDREKRDDPQRHPGEDGREGGGEEDHPNHEREIGHREGEPDERADGEKGAEENCAES